jgi:hypothetical protein|tara:strand:+ start:548 stop:1168 length:621 start_codon:yes stop_codon:yes gene_type:complete
MNLTQLQRIFIVVTVLWILVVAGHFWRSSGLRISKFIPWAVIPVSVFWGGYWILSARNRNTFLDKVFFVKNFDKSISDMEPFKHKDETTEGKHQSNFDKFIHSFLFRDDLAKEEEQEKKDREQEQIPDENKIKLQSMLDEFEFEILSKDAHKIENELIELGKIIQRRKDDGIETTKEDQEWLIRVVKQNMRVKEKSKDDDKDIPKD